MPFCFLSTFEYVVYMVLVVNFLSCEGSGLQMAFIQSQSRVEAGQPNWGIGMFGFDYLLFFLLLPL